MGAALPALSSATDRDVDARAATSRLAGRLRDSLSGAMLSANGRMPTGRLCDRAAARCRRADGAAIRAGRAATGGNVCPSWNGPAIVRVSNVADSDHGRRLDIHARGIVGPGGGMGGGGGSVLMFGDLSPFSVGAFRPPAAVVPPANPLAPVRPTSTRFSANPAPSVRNFKFADNQTPFPVNRVFFTFNYFDNVSQSVNQPQRFELSPCKESGPVTTKFLGSRHPHQSRPAACCAGKRNR